MTSETTGERSAANKPRGVVDRLREQDDKGQIWLAVLVVLAIIASVIMLLTDSMAALKFALIAALWAAVIGFILVGRYRSRARSVEDEAVLREQAHQAELGKAQAEAATAAPTEINSEVLEGIQRELAVVRAQLEELNGREFGFEPAALRAEARRIIELEARTYAHTHDLAGASAPEDDRAPAEDEPLEAEIADKAQQTGPLAPSADAIAGRLGSQPSKRTAQLNPLAALINENAENARRKEQEEAEKTAAAATDSAEEDAAVEKKPAASTKATEPAAPADTAGTKDKDKKDRKGKPAATPATDTTQLMPSVGRHEEPDEDEPASRGRRRRDENKKGVSVAELMANLKKEGKDK